MKSKSLIYSLIFIFLFFNFPLVCADVEQEDVVDSFILDYSTGAYYYNLSRYISGADYYSLEWDFGGQHWLINDHPTDPYFWASSWYEGYYNITIGYVYVPGQGNFSNYLRVQSHTFGGDSWEWKINPFTLCGWNITTENVICTLFSGELTHQLVGFNYTGGQTGFSPSLDRRISDYYLDESYDTYFYLSDHFSNFDYAVVTWVWPAEGHSGTLTNDLYSTTDRCVGQVLPSNSPITICLEGLGGDIAFRGSGNIYGLNTTINISITVYNDYGFAYDTFYIWVDNRTYVYGGGDGSLTDFDGVGDRDGFSFVGYISQIFNAIYPSYDTISTRMRFSYILITCMIITLGGLFLFIGTRNTQYAGISLLILNIVALFYFLAIKYIPYSFLIVFILIALTLSFFKVKAGG